MMNSLSSSSSSYALGLFFLLIVAIIWTFASILISSLYENGNFDSPFLLTYICSSLFIILLLPLPKIRECHTTSTTNIPSEEEDDDEEEINITIISDTMTSATTQYHLQHLRIASMIAPLWFASNFAYNYSLKYTTISSSTVLSSTGSLFTFLFALLTKEEVFTKQTLMGVIFCVLGSILTTVDDYSNGNNTNDDTNNMHIWGDIIGLTAAIGYGFYTVLIRKTCHRHFTTTNNHSSNTTTSTISMALVFGYIGALIMLFFAPIVIFQICFLDDFPSNKELKWIVVNGLLDNVLSDYLWARAVLLTSATVATVGVGLTIPLAFLSDFFIMGRRRTSKTDTLFSVLGAISVLIGFILVNLGAGSDDSDDVDGDENVSNNELRRIQAYHDAVSDDDDGDDRAERKSGTTADLS